MLLRPLRGKEPEGSLFKILSWNFDDLLLIDNIFAGVWNLFSIVRELYRRHDQNATTLLDIITRECLHNDQVRLEVIFNCKN